MIYIIVGMVSFIAGYVLCGRLGYRERADVSNLKDELFYQNIEIKRLKNRLGEK